MKSEIASIRTESNSYRSQINALNIEIDRVFLKYAKDNLGYKEMRKQILKILKSKEDIYNKMLENIKKLEQIEGRVTINDAKKASSNIRKIK